MFVWWILSTALAGAAEPAPGTRAAAAPAPAPSVPLTPAYIQQLTDAMRTNQPALRALDARARAARLATNAVRTWEDPMFTFGGVVSSGRGPMLEEEGDLIYGLEQKLPLFGRPAAERRMAQTETRVAEARLEMQFQLHRRDLAKLLFSAAAADAGIAVGKRDLEWLDTMTAVVGERYQAGTASQSDYLRLLNERALRAEMLVTDTRMRGQTQVAINRLVHRPLDTPIPTLALPEVWPALPETSRLANYAVRFEPNLRLMAREIDTAEAQVAVTRKMQLPEVVAGIEGRQYSGDGGFREGQFTVGLSLPWFNRGRYRHAVSRDLARLEAARLDRESEESRVREDVSRMVVEIDAARREALLYQDQILPRARQALEVAHANWIAGRGMFLETMEARRMLNEAGLMHARAVARQYEALSELVLCCGLGDLESLEMLLKETP